MQKLRLQRVAVISVSLAIIAAIGLVAPWGVREYRSNVQGRAKANPATDADQREILRVLLSERRGLLVPPGKNVSVFLLDRTTPICGGCPVPPTVDSIVWAELDDQQARELRLALIEANGASVAVPQPDVPWVAQSPHASVGDALQAMGGWSGFRDRYPDSAGIVSTSRAVLSNDGQYALVYVGHFAGDLAGRGFLHLLVRDGGTWLVRTSALIWLS